MEDQLLGNGLKQQSCYNATTLRLSSIRVYPGTLESCVVTNPANARLNLSYEYQNNGNISQITDATRSETLAYTYDELDRLDTVSGPYSLDYNYNPIGNITAKGTTTYTYNTSHKHAVASLTTGETYTYDANGNMTQRVEGGLTYNQTFDAENRLISVTVSGQTTQFIYDGDGNLVKKVKPDNSKTIYVGGIYEVDKTSGGSVTRTVTYYPVAGAMRINSTLYYTLKDHLGSASVVTDASGNILGENRYYPFGETRLSTGSILTDKLYTSQREITGLGIYDYKARYYSPKLGRFLSPDTIIPEVDNPQAWNRYSYVYNNPILYDDPTGHCAIACPVLIVAAVAVVAVAIYFYAVVPSPAVLMGRKANNSGNFFPQPLKLIPRIQNKPKYTRGGCLDNPQNIAVCGVILGAFFEIGKNMLKCGKRLCEHDSDPPTLTPTPILTSPLSNTSTSTPSCAPLIQCPNTSTPAPNNTSTSTPPSTSTSPPTSPIYVPAPPNQSVAIPI